MPNSSNSSRSRKNNLLTAACSKSNLCIKAVHSILRQHLNDTLLVRYLGLLFHKKMSCSTQLHHYYATAVDLYQEILVVSFLSNYERMSTRRDCICPWQWWFNVTYTVHLSQVLQHSNVKYDPNQTNIQVWWNLTAWCLWPSINFTMLECLFVFHSTIPQWCKFYPSFNSSK